MTSHCGRFVAPGQRITVGAVYDCKPMSQNRYRTVTLHRPLNLESPLGSLNGVRRVVMIVILRAMLMVTAIVEVVATSNASVTQQLICAMLAGMGRPGWHIECSVVASDILGVRARNQGGSGQAEACKRE